METEILNFLIQILCPKPEVTQICQEFAYSQSHLVYEPIGPIIYFLFFPIVFLIVFIYILQAFIFGKHIEAKHGIRLLISVAVLLFIIMQGYYYLFLILSDLWMFAFLGLGAFWFVTRMRGGGGNGKLPGLGGRRGLDLGRRYKEKMQDEILKASGLEEPEEKRRREMKDEVRKVMDKVKKHGVDSLNNAEKVVYLNYMDITTKEALDIEKAVKKKKAA